MQAHDAGTAAAGEVSSWGSLQKKVAGLRRTAASFSWRGERSRHPKAATAPAVVNDMACMRARARRCCAELMFIARCGRWACNDAPSAQKHASARAPVGRWSDWTAVPRQAARASPGERRVVERGQIQEPQEQDAVERHRGVIGRGRCSLVASWEGANVVKAGTLARSGGALRKARNTAGHGSLTTHETCRRPH
jgi:hypothetical protein